MESMACWWIGRKAVVVGLAALSCACISAKASATQCVGDADGDGTVGAQDLTSVLASWGELPTGKSAGDLSGDGLVNAEDLALVLGQWGVCVAVPDWAALIEAQPDPSVVTDLDLREAIRATGLAWRVRDLASGIEMLLVPAHSFRMGARPSDALAFSDEVPLHHVMITQPYYLGRYETTQAEYEGVMGMNPSHFNQSSFRGDMSRPVESVSFLMIGDFLSETGLRLPTEAEWEFACRAGTDTPTPAAPGQPSTEIAWYEPNSGMETNPVGLLAGNPLGFHDMLGNVWEWVADWYSGGYYAVSPLEDPQGPGGGIFRVIRGGSWYVSDSNLRSSMRGAFWTSGILSDTGFRVARNP